VSPWSEYYILACHPGQSRQTEPRLGRDLEEAVIASSEPSVLIGRGWRAITMWEFSWIERRWPGAGYEDWDRTLDELAERGFNAVRIDPFPHLLAADPHKTWTLRPEWTTQMWGSPDVNRIVLLPAHFDFIGKCGDRGAMVGLSTWYREDDANTRMTITVPEVMAANWIKTLDVIAQAGYIDSILYTDLCNEWPGDDWTPFLKPHMTYGDWDKPASLDYMHKAVALVRTKYPQMPLLFSCATDRPEGFLEHDRVILTCSIRISGWCSRMAPSSTSSPDTSTNVSILRATPT
jgi:hypothetical protein